MEVLRLFIGGEFSSGKTEFIQSISEIDVVSTEQPMSSAPLYMALDFGKFTVDIDKVLYLFGQPGARKVAGVIESLNAGAHPVSGFIFMVPSHRHLEMEQTKKNFHYMLTTDLPCVVAANYQDNTFALSPRQLRVEMNIPAKVPVVPCIAKDETYVRRVLIEYCKLFPEDNLYKRLLRELTTQAALDLDLNQFDAKPEIVWGRIGIFTIGDNLFTELLEGAQYPHVPSRPHERGSIQAHIAMKSDVFFYWFENIVQNMRTALEWDHGGTEGYVLFIDCEKPLLMEEIMQWELLKATGKPFLILLYQQLLSKTVTSSDFRKSFNLPSNVPVLTCDNINQNMIKEIIVNLHRSSTTENSSQRLEQLLRAYLKIRQRDV